MSHADLSWRCPKCFNWIYNGNSCPHCGYTVPNSNASKDAPVKVIEELPDNEVRLLIYWDGAYSLEPNKMDRAEVFQIITDDNQVATIEPPYYESRKIILKKGKSYTLQFRSLYQGKVLHEYPYQLNVDKDIVDSVVMFLERVPFKIKKLFRSRTINIMKIEAVHQKVWH